MRTILNDKSAMPNKHIYLDFQATTPVDPEVLKEMMPYFTERFANPASTGQFGYEINLVVENCRSVIAQKINCLKDEIIFTSGATESINIAIKGLFENLNQGEIVTLKSEHSAVLNTCRYLEMKGIAVNYLDIDANGLVDLNKLSDCITEKTTLVAIMHVNNEIGVIQPIDDIGKICATKNVPFLVDAAQSFGKLKIDVKKSNISILAISGHKIYAPKGLGALYLKKNINSDITPLFHGGGQENGFRSGTLNVTGIVGLAKATEIAMEKMLSEQKRILFLRNFFFESIKEKIADIIVNGDLQQRVAGNLNLSFKNVSGEVLLNRLDNINIVVSRGSACNSTKNQGSHVLKAIGLSDELADSSIRISIGRFTTEKDIIEAAEKISLIVKDIRKISTIS